MNKKRNKTSHSPEGCGCGTESEVVRREVRDLVYGIGFAAKQHILLANRLVNSASSEPLSMAVDLEQGQDPSEHTKKLRTLLKKVIRLDLKADEAYVRRVALGGRGSVKNHQESLLLLEDRIRILLPGFRFNWTMLQEMVLVSWAIEARMKVSQETQRAGSPAVPSASSNNGDDSLLQRLERLVRMSARTLSEKCDRLRALLPGLWELHNDEPDNDAAYGK